VLAVEVGAAEDETRDILVWRRNLARGGGRRNRETGRRTCSMRAVKIDG
jgi:hypothetical protein